MAVTFFNVGTVTAAASGNITPTLPASTLADDIAIVFCAQHDNVVATITAGWTIVDATNSTTGVRGFWAWKRLVGGDANPLITHVAGDAILAQIAVFRGARNSGNPYDVKSVQANAASTTVTAPAITPGTANSHIVWFGAVGDDGTFSAYSGTNPTFVERVDQLTALGLDASIGAASADSTSVASLGARTATNSRSAVNVGFMFALVPSTSVTVTAQVCALTLTPVAGAITVGAVSVVAQPCSLVLAGVQGTISAGGGSVTVTAQVCALTLTPVANAPIVGAVVVVAQPCSLVLTPVAGTRTTGPVTVVAQPCTLSLAPVAGTITTGSVSVPAQPCTLTLTGVQGSISSGAGSATVTAQVCQLTLTPVAGTISTGAVTVAAQPCTFTLTPQPGARTTGAVSVVAQSCALTLAPQPGTLITGPITVVAQPCTFTLAPVTHTPSVASNVTVAAQLCTLVLVCVPGTVTARAGDDTLQWAEVLALHSALKSRETLWAPMPAFPLRRSGSMRPWPPGR